MINPVAGLIIWLVMTTSAVAGAVWLVRLLTRAVRALEKRSTVAEEVLLLSARVAQQERELAELRSTVQRLQALPRSAHPAN